MSARTVRNLAVVLAFTVAVVTGCQWRGINSMPLPGTAGNDNGSFEIKAQIADITNIERNSRVRVGDVTVGNVTAIELQDWHALVTMRLDGDVDLPANATAKVGQTSLLGSLHIELAAPSDAVPAGKLAEGSLIQLGSTGAYPTTEQTLAAVSMLLNGGGLGQLRDITDAFVTALADGRDQTVKDLIGQLRTFTTRIDEQTDDIIRAAESLNNLAGQFARQKPVIDAALQTIPRSAAILADERDRLTEALDKVGDLSALADSAIAPTKDALVQELSDIGPVLKSLADAGPALTRSLELVASFPYPQDRVDKTARGDYLNLSLIIDLTLSRIDAGFLTGTRFEGDLTELEMQWGRTIGQMPSPYTAGNPLIAPYHYNQGP